ncbi:MAG: ATP-binding protein [Gemmatimonadaceae bacterium]
MAATTAGVNSFSLRGPAAGSGAVIETTAVAEGARVTAGPAGGRYARVLWAVAAGGAALAAARWVRDPRELYLAVGAVATAAAALAVPRLGAMRRTAAACVAALAVLLAVGAASQAAIRRIDREWPAHASRMAAEGGRAMGAELARTASELRFAAQRAVAAPTDPRAAAAQLAALVGSGEERGVVLYERNAPLAWSGVVRVATDTVRAPLTVIFTPFYLVVAAAAEQGTRRAVATALVHADPPADRLARGLDVRVAQRTGLRGFEFAPAPPGGVGVPPGWLAFAPAGTPLFGVRPMAPVQGEVRLRTVDRARVRGALLLALALVLFLAAAWRRPATLAGRLAALLAPLGAVAIVPLNAYSNASRLFDPSFYYATLGGPFTASVGALGLTSALFLLGLLAVLRSPVHFRHRAAALVAVLVVAGLGPFLLRDLARGISPPAAGVSAGLWIAWQVTIFLAAVSVLLAGVSAGRALLGGRRGLPPALAPSLAGAAALLAPVVWEAPGRFPGWYPVLWIAAIAALALSRRTPALVLTAALVAGFGATALVWGTTSKKRVQLAQADVAGLATVDPNAELLLERFAAELAEGPPPNSRGELLRRYVRSDLPAAGYPVELQSWSGGGEWQATLVVSPFLVREPELRATVDSARAQRSPVMREVSGIAGVQLMLAVPNADSSVTSVVIAPRTRLIPGDPFVALLGLTPVDAAEPPYVISAAEAERDAVPEEGEARWRRDGDELHGDRVLSTASGPVRVHVEVELRSLDALVQRGALIVLLDLAVLSVLWMLSALADGGMARWTRARTGQWARSYRAQLTLALFLFFVIPAVVFAVWSYRRLKADDRAAREVRVGETLRAVAASGPLRTIRDAGFGTPILLYARGELREASDTLYEMLAPTGRFLRPDVHLSLGLSDEIAASRTERVGSVNALFGYRAALSPTLGRVVIAAPARTDELALDRRRRDLGVLVLFFTAVGALAALGLSGIAARQFAMPIGALREAALRIAAGEREPELAVGQRRPPSEFAPVFSAFRRMAADLAQSRSALESAERRLAAVLRNVASGVLAVDERGVIALANPRAEELLGRAAPPGTTLAELHAPELAARVTEFLASSDEDRELEVTLGGRELSGRLTRLARPAGVAVVTMDDVTDLKRAERVLAWGEMARQVAHEIKNPLTPIRLGVQHLRRAHADRRADFDRILEQNVARILDEIQRLDEIARTFSKYGTAKTERAPSEAVDVARIARDVVELERMGEGGGVSWQVTGADGARVAMAHEGELREVLLNLLENSRHASASAVRVDVAGDDGWVELRVADDGEGIPEDVLPKIFEPHFSTKTSGSGLGLAISRQLVDGWGGSIAVSSERGKGTEVVIRLRGAD